MTRHGKPLTLSSYAISISFLPSELLDCKTRGMKHTIEIDIQCREIRFDKVSTVRVVPNPAPLSHACNREDPVDPTRVGDDTLETFKL